MKFEVTQPGVYWATGKEGEAEQEQEIGTVLDVDGDTLPNALRNKGRILNKDGKPKAPAAERQARLKELAGGLSDGDFAADGKPDVRKINDLLDEGEAKFTADERDQLWAGA